MSPESTICIFILMIACGGSPDAEYARDSHRIGCSITPMLAKCEAFQSRMTFSSRFALQPRLRRCDQDVQNLCRRTTSRVPASPETAWMAAKTESLLGEVKTSPTTAALSMPASM